MENSNKPIYKRWWFIVLLVIGIGLIVYGLSDTSDTPNTSKTTLAPDTIESTSSNKENSSSSSSVETKNETKKSYKVGEVYEDRNIAIKYVALDDNFKGYNKYATVKSGYKVIKADFEFENVGSSDFLASSYSFNCYADGYDCESFWSVSDSTFSSTLSSGKKAKGSVYYEVPQNAKEITIEYETNMWTNNKVIFVVK